MGNCSHVNQAKSGPSNGWYCDVAGGYVDSSYYKNYCSGSTSYKHCPYLGGDDSFRSSDSEPESTGYSDSGESGYGSSGYGSSSGYSGGYSGGGSSGSGSSGGGLVDAFLDGVKNLTGLIVKLFMIGALIWGAVTLLITYLPQAIYYLGAQIGVVQSPVTINFLLPEDSSIQIGDVSFWLVAKNGMGKATEMELDEDGVYSCALKKGSYELLVKYDGLSFSMGVSSIDGAQTYSLNLDADTDFLENRVVNWSFCDEKGKEIFPEQITVTDSAGNPVDAVELEENRFVSPLVNLENTGTLSVSVDGYQTVFVEPEVSGRIMNCTVVLKQGE